MTKDGKYKGAYVVWGPPGTGKTTWLARQVESIIADDEGPVLLCSLTRTAAAELAKRDLRLPREMIGTLHSHAYRALGRPPVAESLLAEWNEVSPEYRVSAGMAEVDDLAGDEQWERLPGDAHYEKYHLLRARCVDRKVWGLGVRQFAAAWEGFKRDTGSIDFTDMIDRARAEPAPGAPEVVIADEAQDLSALEFDLLRTWGKRAGALMVAGDPWQALYTWRGAHPEIFMNPEILRSGRRKVLGQSYRVSAAVHAAAMSWVQQLSTYEPISYQPTEAAGDVTTLPVTWKDPGRIIDAAERWLDEGLEVMVCASCGFMLSPLLSVLRRRGVPFSNPWRRKRGDWNPLGRGAGVTMSQRVLDFFRPDAMGGEKPDRWWTWSEVGRWVEAMRSGDVLVRGAKKRVDQMSERSPDAVAPVAEVLQWLQPWARARVLEWFTGRAHAMLGVPGAVAPPVEPMLEWFLEAVMAARRKAAVFPVAVAQRRGLDALKTEPRLYVGTIHSFKGGEADVVIVLPDLSPAARRQWGRRGEARDSVVRCFYVALTRARRSVALCRARSPELAVDLARYAA